MDLYREKGYSHRVSEERYLFDFKMMVNQMGHISCHRHIVMNLPMHRVSMVPLIASINRIPQLIQFPTPMYQNSFSFQFRDPYFDTVLKLFFEPNNPCKHTIGGPGLL